MSKRSRSIEPWAILKVLVRPGVAALVERLCERARLFARLAASEGFRVVNDVVFNQVLIACADDDAARSMLERIQRFGECWCGGSTLDGEAVIHVSVCSWQTTEDDIRHSVEAFVVARGSD